jgi:hypothetical protein
MAVLAGMEGWLWLWVGIIDEEGGKNGGEDSKKNAKHYNVSHHACMTVRGWSG